MGDVITRKCACCKEYVEIDVDDIKDVLYHNKVYYHKDCFVVMATEKADSKRGKPQMWQDALEHIDDIEAETAKMLESYAAKEILNLWLLDNYDITMIPTRFWQIVMDLEKGLYKNQRCKPINTKLLCECWKWGQRKLNEIAVANKMNHKGPANDTDRLRYDLAVLIGKVPNYLSYKERHKAARDEMERTTVVFDDIDMSKIGQGQQTKRKDISDISDDIFTE